DAGAPTAYAAASGMANGTVGAAADGITGAAGRYHEAVRSMAQGGIDAMVTTAQSHQADVAAAYTTISQVAVDAQTGRLHAGEQEADVAARALIFAVQTAAQQEVDKVRAAMWVMGG